MVNPNYKAQRNYPHTHLKVTSNDGLATVYVKTVHFSVNPYEVIAYIKRGDTTNQYTVTFSSLDDAQKYAESMIEFANKIFAQKENEIFKKCGYKDEDNNWVISDPDGVVVPGSSNELTEALDLFGPLVGLKKEEDI